jgi:chromosome segregation ATPase
MGSAEKNFAAREAIVARLQSQVDQLQRALRVRTTELGQADRHIARLEESLLKLKQARRELQKLKR